MILNYYSFFQNSCLTFFLFTWSIFCFGFRLLACGGKISQCFEKASNTYMNPNKNEKCGKKMKKILIQLVF